MCDSFIMPNRFGLALFTFIAAYQCPSVLLPVVFLFLRSFWRFGSNYGYRFFITTDPKIRETITWTQCMRAADIPSVIFDAISRNTFHAFFINNPIVLTLACLAIARYQIPLRNVIVFPIRNMDCTILDGANIIQQQRYHTHKLDRLVQALGVDSRGWKLRRILESDWGDFIAYTGWAYPSMRVLFRSNKCNGHVYLEEGDMAYLPSRLRKHRKGSYRFSNIVPLSQVKENYLSTASAHLTFLPDAFPFVPENLKWHLSNHKDIFDFYKPCLMHADVIVLVPFVYGNIDWHSFWTKVESLTSGYVAIKPHPRYACETEAERRLIASMPKSLQVRALLAPDGTIVEAEMMASKKTIIGPGSSLRRYADALGSDYIALNPSGHRK